MALTNQPYLPLYVGDWMNNNKLKMCSPAAHGIMIAVMCIMHKEADYGTIQLKQKFKQTDSIVKNFALQITKLTAFDLAETEKPLQELINEGILTIEGNRMQCPRMVKDFELSVKRATAGRSGGLSTKNKNTAKTKKEAPPKAKQQANTENETATENEVITESKGKEGMGEKPQVQYPYESDEFMQQWQVWKNYRAQEHRFYYRSAESEQAALAELATLATDEVTAIAIIHQSMGKGWKGFFELKSNEPKSKTGTGKGRVQYSDDFKRKIAQRLQSG